MMQLCNQLKRNLYTLLAVIGVLSVWTLSAHALQQQAADPYAAYVTGDDLYVRSGAGSTYYPFGKVNEGDIITIVGERFGWARVLTKGYAFHKFFGYVEVEDISLKEGETTGIALGKIDVLAPNLNRGGDPAGSWKWIARIPAETKVTVVGIEKAVAQDYYKIVLPEAGIGWISAQFVRPATTSELEDWNLRVARALKGKGADEELIKETATEIVKIATEAAEKAAADTATETTTAAADTTQEKIDPVTTEATAPAKTDADTTETMVAENTATEKATETDIPVTETVAANDTTEATTDAVANPPLANTETTMEETATETTTKVVKLTAAEILGTLTIDDLEDSYDILRKEAVRNAEIEPLRQRYLAIRELYPDEKRTAAIAAGRIKLLEARLELQKQLHNLDRVRKIADLTDQDARASRIAVEKAADYAAVGRVTPSTIYNGKSLPLLLRLTDPATGRTVAYIEPDATAYDFTTLIGELIGVVGKKAYDGSLRLNIITPKRIDVLTPVEDKK